MNKEIMTPNHDRWNEFVVDLKEEIKHRDVTYKTTRAVLHRMKNIDIEETLKLFASLGGSCDFGVGLLVDALGKKYVDANVDAKVEVDEVVDGELDGEVS